MIQSRAQTIKGPGNVLILPSNNYLRKNNTRGEKYNDELMDWTSKTILEIVKLPIIEMLYLEFDVDVDVK